MEWKDVLPDPPALAMVLIVLLWVSLLPAGLVAVPAQEMMSTPELEAPLVPESLSLHRASPKVGLFGGEAVPPDGSGLPDVSTMALLIPVEGVQAEELVDSFQDPRGANRIHQAIDIMADRHTPIYAAASGHIRKLSHHPSAGISIYQFDGKGEYGYFYAHLNRYAPGLKEGQRVRRGQLLGYVGSTGNASPDAPHLHFAVHELIDKNRWWSGEAINPYPLLTQIPGEAAAG